jgi:hypothetical protein
MLRCKRPISASIAHPLLKKSVSNLQFGEGAPQRPRSDRQQTIMSRLNRKPSLRLPLTMAIAFAAGLQAHAETGGAGGGLSGL